jgi:hypothetical protein
VAKAVPGKMNFGRAEKRRARHRPKVLHCCKCQRPLEAGEPVWLRTRRVAIAPYVVRRRGLNAWCGACIKARDVSLRELHCYGDGDPCETCGRPVHYARDVVHTFCSLDCKLTAIEAKAKAKRREARGETRECLECNETFEPRRADAKFCSGACKQRAHRKRVTLSKCPARKRTESRNAVTLSKCHDAMTVESRNEGEA